MEHFIKFSTLTPYRIQFNTKRIVDEIREKQMVALLVAIHSMNNKCNQWKMICQFHLGAMTKKKKTQWIDFI